MLEGAIVGIGKIAQTGHLPAYLTKQIRERAEVVAGVDPNEQSRMIAAEQYPHLRLYENVEQLFNEEKVDFIDICATPQVHGQIINAAVRQGIHILCEKPFALSLKEAENLSNLLRKERSLAFVLGHQYRFSPLWQQMKSFLSNGKPGDKWFLQFNVFRKEADPGLHVDGPKWRTKPHISGGGMMADTGVHYLYLSLWMLGMPYSVTAQGYQLRDGDDTVEDTAFVVLESGQQRQPFGKRWQHELHGRQSDSTLA
jgi:predicted dehydrogenase